MRKALVVSYYFPPMGMGGVQRTAKFVKYLPSFGWEVSVLTVTPKAYLAVDNSLLIELEQPRIKIYRTAGSSSNGEAKVISFKKDSTRKFLSNLSQIFLIPDSKILWKKKAVSLGTQIIKDESTDLIYATAPPYTDFLIANELKKKHGIPVVFDYRDSWHECPNNFYPTPFHKRKHTNLESGLLRCADKIVTINSRIKELIIEEYPFVKDENVSVIPQGYDEEDFLEKNSAQQHKTKMRITYAGSFLNYYTPEYFLRAFSDLLKRKPEYKNKIEACFVGMFDSKYEKLIQELHLSGDVIITGYVSHSECIRYLIATDVLWMMINKTERSDLHSTGKLYEYFGAGKPVLACVPEGVAKESLQEHGACEVCEPDNIRAISEAIEKFFKMYETDSLPKPNEAMITKYERKHLTSRLAEIFEEVLSQNRKPEGVITES